MDAAFAKLVEETKMLKSYLVFGDGNGGVVKVPYDQLDDFLASDQHQTH